MVMREWMSDTSGSICGLSDIHHAIIGGDIRLLLDLCMLKFAWIQRRRRAKSLWMQFEQLETDPAMVLIYNIYIYILYTYRFFCLSSVPD